MVGDDGGHETGEQAGFGGAAQAWAVAVRLPMVLLVMALGLSALLAVPAFAASSGVQSFTIGTPGTAFGFVEPFDPLLTAGDPADEQLAFTVPLASVPASASAETGRMDLGGAGVDKEFLSLIWNATTDRGAQYIVYYSVDGRAWLSAVGHGGFDLPDPLTVRPSRSASG